MADYETDAVQKLDAEYKKGSYDKYAQAMRGAVLKALKDFVKQDAEFAQAVVQGGSFEDCMKAVAKNCGSSISDLDAYRKAVQFYFPGAEIRMTMTIDLIGGAAAGEDAPPKGVVLDLWALI
ncbi:MAG: hypothetical protein IK149_01645 [Oscillospiraceae bacterium]|nr:hypothetical protein [Oscillospiraceae bacterium]